VTTFGPYKATVVEIHDGDTFDVDIVLVAKQAALKSDRDLGFNVHRQPEGVVLENQSVRLYGCNAAELSTPAGKTALAFLQTVLHVGDVVTVLSYGWDKYGGRIDGAVTLADGRDLTAVMVAANQAAAWDGQGAKPVPAA
jgi:endonuclease YncB( thermonuclease family)